MDHRWKLKLNAGSYYVDLATCFDGEDLSLCYSDDPETGPEFYAFSNHLDALDDISAVSSRCFAFELLLNGALRLVFGDEIYFTDPIRFAVKVFDLEKNCFILLERGLPDESPFERNVQRNNLKEGPVNPVARLIDLAHEDEDFRILMFQVGLIAWPGESGEIFSWGTLYKVYETVKTLYRRLEPYKYVEAREIANFKAACNNIRVLGLSSRHGITNHAAPTSATLKLDIAILDVMAMARVLLPTECLLPRHAAGKPVARNRTISVNDLFGDETV